MNHIPPGCDGCQTSDSPFGGWYIRGEGVYCLPCAMKIDWKTEQREREREAGSGAVIPEAGPKDPGPARRGGSRGDGPILHPAKRKASESVIALFWIFVGSLITVGLWRLALELWAYVTGR